MKRRSKNNCLKDYINAGSADIPRSELTKLALSPNSRVRLRVAENHRTPTNTLMLLAYDESVYVKIAVAANPNTPRKTASEIASSDCVMTRLGLAEEASTPKYILDKLAQDENPYVAFQADKTIAILYRTKLEARKKIKLDNVRQIRERINSRVC